jgi:uncharacterized protein (UPF0128 family)
LVKAQKEIGLTLELKKRKANFNLVEESLPPKVKELIQSVFQELKLKP